MSRQSKNPPEVQQHAVPAITAAPDSSEMDRWIALQEEMAQSHSEGASVPLVRSAAAGY